MQQLHRDWRDQKTLRWLMAQMQTLTCTGTIKETTEVHFSCTEHHYLIDILEEANAALTQQMADVYSVLWLQMARGRTMRMTLQWLEGAAAQMSLKITRMRMICMLTLCLASLKSMG